MQPAATIVVAVTRSARHARPGPRVPGRPAPGCGREGDPSARGCRPALDARLDQPAGRPDRAAGRPPGALLQVEWCAPFAGVVRDALHAPEVRRRAPAGRAARRGDRAALGAGGAGGDLLVPVPVHARPRAPSAATTRRPSSPRSPARIWACRSRRSSTTARDDRPVRPRPARRARRTSPGRSRSRPPATRAAVRGRWVVLVDDVMTTGRHAVGLRGGAPRGRRARRLGGHRGPRAMSAGRPGPGRRTDRVYTRVRTPAPGR